jgi:4-amino-4-deoxy-L-arabinose transferase-like glycosyltransferase
MQTKPAPHQLLCSTGFWAALLLGAVIIWASFYNLANYPDLWWDEAIFSETAANVVRHGRYAFTEQSPNQLSDFDYRISAGPAVILPVALSYRLLGVGLVQGRAVAGLYLVFTFLALFLVSRRLFGPAAALLAGLLALVGTDVVHWGRPVLGDVPALGLFLFATWLIIRSLEEDSPICLFLGGLFLGLAFDAKEFYGVAFLPPLAVLFLQHRRDWRTLTRQVILFILGIAVPLLSYLAFKAVILGGLMPAVLHFLRQKALLRHEFFTPLTIGRVYLESFRYLLTNPLFLAGLVGTFWLWRTNRLTLSPLLWLADFGLWSLMYLTAIFWPRFALPALFLAAPLAAYLLCRVWAHLTAGLAPRPLKLVTAGLLAASFFWFLPVAGLNDMQNIAQYRKNIPNRLVAYLRQHIPRRTLIETPEYELVFLDDEHRIHTMPSFFIVQSGEKGVELLNPRQNLYNFNQTKADVLVLGYFGKSIFAQIYPPALVAKDWQKVAQLDYYDIYVRRSSALLRAPDSPVRTSTSPPLPIFTAKGKEAHGPKTLRRSVSH